MAPVARIAAMSGSRFSMNQPARRWTAGTPVASMARSRRSRPHTGPLAPGWLAAHPLSVTTRRRRPCRYALRTACACAAIAARWYAWKSGLSGMKPGASITNAPVASATAAVRRSSSSSGLTCVRAPRSAYGCRRSRSRPTARTGAPWSSRARTTADPVALVAAVTAKRSRSGEASCSGERRSRRSGCGWVRFMPPTVKPPRTPNQTTPWIPRRVDGRTGRRGGSVPDRGVRAVAGTSARWVSPAWVGTAADSSPHWGM